VNPFIAAFTSNILPIILAAAVGVVLGRTTDVQPASLSKVALHVFFPCLIFQLITAGTIDDRDILLMLGFTLTLTIVVTLVMGGLGRALGWPKSIIAAAMLACLATNSANYGMSLVQFAFGDRALPYGSLFMVDNNLILFTLGVAIASWGSGKPGSPLAVPFKYPFIYAFIAALIFSHLHLALPLPVDRVVNLFGAAAIPTMLVLLGLQLNRCEWRRPNLALLLTNLTRLVTSPAIALALAAVFALEGPARQAGILQAAMPTAVSATVLATEFDLEPSFLTVTVAISTLLSFITLTPLIVYLS
jgi:predicted permease